MWNFKQTAKTLWSVSKSLVIDNRTKEQKLLDEISLSQQDIISTTKLNQLATATYQIEQFQSILEDILKRIKTFQYDLDEARKTINILIAINYLIKHGATAFVDELRNYINVFKKYQSLKDLKIYQDKVFQKQLSYQLQKIKSRAMHIEVLLSDKQKLLKEKQLSMLIKQKMKLYQKNLTSDAKLSFRKDDRNQKIQKELNNEKNCEDGHPNRRKIIQNYANKLDGFLQKYLWKYVDKFDEKMQVISDKVFDGFDRYVLGELPSNFEPEDVEDDNEEYQSDQKIKRQLGINIDYQGLQDNDDELMKKLQLEGGARQHENLIDFEEAVQTHSQNKYCQEESLI